MKISQANSVLPAALSVSIAVHAVILIGVRFVVPEFQHWYTIAKDPPILLNTADGPPPIHADLEAQVNHEGGGNSDSGYAKSPLPDMQRTEEGDELKATKRRMDELEAQQALLTSQVKSRPDFVPPQVEKTEQNQPQGNDNFDNDKSFARRAAVIEKEVDDYNKRPRKTEITPATKRKEYALYFNQVRTKIEKIGTLNFPVKDGKKLYGKLILHIPIYQDGSLYLKDGGPTVQRSSGSHALDRAALRIVQ
ncbi:MAG: energy transducer TonB, partial [Burkholderiaceae bacterium]|nr:energy transducer TonB [Burkholderiaceae bacterium]